MLSAITDAPLVAFFDFETLVDGVFLLFGFSIGTCSSEESAGHG